MIPKYYIGRIHIKSTKCVVLLSINFFRRHHNVWLLIIKLLGRYNIKTKILSNNANIFQICVLRNTYCNKIGWYYI